MSSGEEGQPIASEGASLQRQKTRRVKVLLGTLAVLCVAAALAACAAFLSKGGEENSMDTDDMQSRGDLLVSRSSYLVCLTPLCNPAWSPTKYSASVKVFQELYLSD